jgi:tetratricopeptide (TPR) repeat protein
MQRIGEILSAQGNYAESIPYLETAVQNARSKVEEAESLMALLKAYNETQRYQEVITTAEKLESLDGILPESTPQALLNKAKAQFALKQDQAAGITLAVLVDEYKTIEGAEGLFLLAESYQKQGQIDLSNDSIFEMSGPFADFDYWYGRMFLLLAENYLLSGEDFQAKATLESIVENSTNEEIKKLAQDKLQTLN